VKSFTRRDCFRLLGVSLALPALESFAQAVPAGATKKRFVGCFFGSGAAMPNATSGDWTFEGALSPLVARGLQPNVAIMRGFRALELDDPHWAGTAAFLSCNELGQRELQAPNRLAGERCGKSFDQYVADLESTKLRGLHAGWSTVPSWDETHDKHYSIQYVNCIAWRDERNPIQNTRNPQELFVRVFGDGTSVADPKIQYLLNRRRSIMDGLTGQLSAFRKQISSADGQKMDSYESGIREVEKELSNSLKANTCVGAGARVEDPSAYLANLRTMQKIMVKAFQCNAARAGTVMYNEGIGDNSIHPSLPRFQHDSAHNSWESLMQINRMQVGLWAELVADLKDAGLLEETVLVLGSNMSDGRSHNTANTPLLVASAGPGLKLGGEVMGSATPAVLASNRTFADLYMDLFPLYGIDKTEFGEGAYRSSGRPSGIRT
jgi:hypothetical protein